MLVAASRSRLLALRASRLTIGLVYSAWDRPAGGRWPGVIGADQASLTREGRAAARGPPIGARWLDRIYVMHLTSSDCGIRQGI